jgi:hypothetical protein
MLQLQRPPEQEQALEKCLDPVGIKNASNRKYEGR